MQSSWVTKSYSVLPSFITFINNSCNVTEKSAMIQYCVISNANLLDYVAMRWQNKLLLHNRRNKSWNLNKSSKFGVRDVLKLLEYFKNRRLFIAISNKYFQQLKCNFLYQKTSMKSTLTAINPQSILWLSDWRVHFYHVLARVPFR